MKYLFFSLVITIPFLGFGQWTQLGDDIDGEHAGDLSGFSVSLNADGNIIAIGSIRNGDAYTDAGHVRVYKNISGNWIQMGADIDGEALADQSGYSVKLSADGETVAIGARINDGVNGEDSGHVRVYSFDLGTDTWVQLGDDIDGKVANDRFGAAIDLSSDGRTLVAGARLNSTHGMYAGVVHIYRFNEGTDSWEPLGNDIAGEAAGDQNGYAVAINNDGSTVAIGAVRNDDGGGNSGHARVFSYNSGTNMWEQMGSDIDGNIVNDNFGAAVSMNGDGGIVAVSSYFNSNGGNASGHTIVYYYDVLQNDWEQLGNEIQGEGDNDNSGYATSLSDDGHTIAIGAIRNDGINGNNSGHVRIFKYNALTDIWEQHGSDIDGEGSNDRLGRTVSLSADGSIVAAGADINGGNGTNSGHTRIYEYLMMTLSTEGVSIGPKIEAFPNPSNGITHIVFNHTQEDIALSVFNILGKQVVEKVYQNVDKITLDLSDFMNGTYLAQLKMKDNIELIRLIVE